MLKIHKTNNYSQFQFFKSNRKTSPKLLIESIQNKNLLESHPILCTPSDRDPHLLYVVDGQNRLEAAKALNLDIFYVIDENLSEEDIPTCQIQRTWDLGDWLRYHKATKTDYQFIEEIMDLHPFQLHFVVSQCTNVISPYSQFREGTYTIKRDRNRLRIIFSNIADILKSITDIYPTNRVTVNSLKAFWMLISNKQYNHEHFKKQINTYKDQIILTLKYKGKDPIFDGLLNKVYNYYSKGHRIDLTAD